MMQQVKDKSGRETARADSIAILRENISGLLQGGGVQLKPGQREFLSSSLETLERLEHVLGSFSIESEGIVKRNEQTQPSDSGEGLKCEEEKYGKDILIVDDEPSLLRYLRFALETMGYRSIRECSNGLSALESIRTKIPDLIILDMQMPQMNGYEVIGWLKGDTRTTKIPILVLTADTVKIDQMNEYIREKAIPVLSKPANHNHLRKMVEYLI